MFDPDRFAEGRPTPVTGSYCPFGFGKSAASLALYADLLNDPSNRAQDLHRAAICDAGDQGWARIRMENVHSSLCCCADHAESDSPSV
jgi:hypothetical protein